jgi:peptide-methionine (R)-S-oxide reductase
VDSQRRIEKMAEKKFPQTEEEWRGILTPMEFHVLREKGTERPFTGDYWNHHEKGTYRCAGCGEELFSSNAKFDSGCGWPSFYEGLDRSKIEEHEDDSYGMRRVEVTCRSCEGHLGHVFPDGFGTPTGMRYCINSVSIKFVPE